MAKKQGRAQKYDPRVVGALAAGVEALEEIEGYAQAAAWLGGDDSVDLDALPGTLALSAIEAAVRTAAVARLQALETAPKALRKLSRAGLHRLKASGVEVEAAPVAGSFSLGREQVQVPPRAYLTPADDQGYSEFVLGVTDDEGSCVLMGWFGGAEGFRELSHGHISRSSLRKLYREVEEQVQHMVEVPFSEALHHILPSVDLAASAHGHAPHDWEHFATHLKPAWLEQARAAQPLGELPAEPEEGQLDATGALGGHPWFRAWPVSERALVHAMGGFFGAMGAEGEAELEAAADDAEQAAELAEASAEGAEQAAELAEASAEGAEQVDGAEASEPPALARTMMDDAMTKAAAEALADPMVRQEWARRAGLAATLARASGEAELLETLRHLGAALHQGFSGERIALTTGAVQSQILQQAFANMQQFEDGAELG